MPNSFLQSASNYYMVFTEAFRCLGVNAMDCVWNSYRDCPISPSHTLEFVFTFLASLLRPLGVPVHAKAPNALLDSPLWVRVQQPLNVLANDIKLQVNPAPHLDLA